MNESMLTMKMSGKMQDFVSISTACSTNEICQGRIKKAIADIRKHSKEAEEIINRYLLPSDDKMHLTGTTAVNMLTAIGCKVCVCVFCYADKAQKFHKFTKDKMSKNGAFLSVEKCADELPTPCPNEINGMKPFRFEALGDLINVAHAKNYMKMCLKNADADCALWTKNPHLLWTAVLAMGGKPQNVQFVLSSPYVNKPDIGTYWRYNARCNEVFGYPLFDKLFTVWTEDEAKKKNVQFNCCGADGMKDRKCKNCLNCYKRENYNEFVNELLR